MNQRELQSAKENFEPIRYPPRREGYWTLPTKPQVETSDTGVHHGPRWEEIREQTDEVTALGNQFFVSSSASRRRRSDHGIPTESPTNILWRAQAPTTL